MASEVAITAADVLNAYDVISPYVHRTPVLTSRTFDALAGEGRRVFFKCEVGRSSKWHLSCDLRVKCNCRLPQLCIGVCLLCGSRSKRRGASRREGRPTPLPACV